MGAADKDKGKKCKVEEEEELDQNEGELLVFIDKLQQVQDELEKVNEEASEKVLEVEQKYNEVRRPVYAKRTEIIKSIPDFWLTAFLSHPALGDLLNEEDQKIFKYLSTIDVEDFKDLKSGYSITFSFNPNPYFEDEKLTKTFSFTDDVVTATKIKWKEGKDLCNGDNHEKKGNKRPFTEESFFTWFSDGHENDITGGFQDEVADVIKDDLWPNPLRYFNNEADEDFEDEEDDDEEGNGVEEDEDDEDGADEKDS